MRGLAAFFAVLLAATGVANAAWMAPGSLEPSTLYDRDHGSMFANADEGAGAPRVYFNAFVSVEGLTFNPNVALAGGRFLPPGAVHHRAMLGIWKDCNGDRYVGMLEGGVQDYPTSLLLQPEPCRVGGLFNDGEWVSEMIGIGMVDPCEFPRPDGTRSTTCQAIPEFHLNERVFYANGTKVWADIGAPGDVPPAECPVAPPPGTTSGTGALLSYLDCQEGRHLAEAVNAADPDGSLGLRFEDPAHPERSSSALNVVLPVTLFGGPHGPGLLSGGTGAPAARAWDCSAPRETRVREPTGLLGPLAVTDPTGGDLTGPQPALPVVGRVTIFPDHDDDPDTPGVLQVSVEDEEGDLAHVPRPAPSLDDPTGSWWDATTMLVDGPLGDCDPDTLGALDAAQPGPLVESGVPQVDEARKDRASLTFTFYDGHRGINERIDFLAGETAPSDGGLVLFRHGRGGAGPLWSADVASVQEPQLVARGSLKPSGGQHWTYYATLGRDAIEQGFQVPAGGSFVYRYASEACGTSTSGVRNGWVCDPALWWRDALGHDATPRYVSGLSYAPIPGEPYHLRDVDCYDGHVAEESVFLSLAQLTEEVCKTA